MNKIDGTSGDDRIIGTAGEDDIQGGDGRDRLNGGDGNDIVSGGADNDYVYGDGGDDTLYGGDGNDALVGHSGEDTIYGEDGNDGVFGGGNADQIFGGNGNDTLFGDGGNDLIDGGAGDDKIYGGSGNDTLVYTAGEGVDQISGNTGIDTLQINMTSADLDAARSDLADFANWLDGQIADAGGEAAHAGRNNADTFTIDSMGLTVSSIERVELTVDGESVPLVDILNQAPVAAAQQDLSVSEDFSIAGTVGATDPDGDTLSCSVSQDPVNGVCELDAHTGEFTYTPNADFSGTDTFKVLIEDGNGGSTEQLITVTVDAQADAPTLTAAVSEVSSSQITGTDDGETIVGTSGDDTIDGGAGNDTIYGDGAGGSGVTVALDIAASLNDADGSETLTVSIDGVPDDVSLSAGTNLGGGTWQLGEGDLAGLTMTLAEPADVTLDVTATATEANGSSHTVSQQLSVEAAGMGGDDVIAGGAGNDTIHGGAGTDIADYSGSNGAVYVDLSAGFAVGEGFDRLNGIEGANGSEAGDVLVGNNGDNVFNGGGGGDAIYAFGGNDTIDGGAGGDALYGYSGNDTIIGGEGNDYIDGGSGTDTASYETTTGGGVSVDLNNGQVSGAAGRDRLNSIENVTGSQGDDDLSGSREANVLVGGAGDDTLRGHRGADVLTGGEGADTFEFKKSDVVSGRNHHGVDRITDFGAGDTLDFTDLLNGQRFDQLSDVIQTTVTDEGTMLSLDIRGTSGFTDVVFLEGVFDLDLDFLDGSGQVIV
ncbi:MAG: cadherin-like domain-containing protein [Alphaproteobacteria bacterium]|nr:cadherin-like domain-containing protein [Alphaproteobacteria bacterium]